MKPVTTKFEKGDYVTIKIDPITAEQLNRGIVAAAFFKAEDVILHDKETEVAHG